MNMRAGLAKTIFEPRDPSAADVIDVQMDGCTRRSGNPVPDRVAPSPAQNGRSGIQESRARAPGRLQQKRPLAIAVRPFDPYPFDAEWIEIVQNKGLPHAV